MSKVFAETMKSLLDGYQQACKDDVHSAVLWAQHDVARAVEDELSAIKAKLVALGAMHDDSVYELMSEDSELNVELNPFRDEFIMGVYAEDYTEVYIERMVFQVWCVRLWLYPQKDYYVGTLSEMCSPRDISVPVRIDADVVNELYELIAGVEVCQNIEPMVPRGAHGRSGTLTIGALH